MIRDIECESYIFSYVNDGAVSRIREHKSMLFVHIIMQFTYLDVVYYIFIYDYPELIQSHHKFMSNMIRVNLHVEPIVVCVCNTLRNPYASLIFLALYKSSKQHTTHPDDITNLYISTLSNSDRLNEHGYFVRICSIRGISTTELVSKFRILYNDIDYKIQNLDELNMIHSRCLLARYRTRNVT